MYKITPVSVTKTRAKQILREAHKAGTLVAQSHHPDFNGGAYWLPDGTRCAIGQMFCPPDAKRLERGGEGYMMAPALIRRGLLIVAKANEKWFADVQLAHDDWATARKRFDAIDIQLAEKKFLGMLR